MQLFQGLGLYIRRIIVGGGQELLLRFDTHAFTFFSIHSFALTVESFMVYNSNLFYSISASATKKCKNYRAISVQDSTIVLKVWFN